MRSEVESAETDEEEESVKGKLQLFIRQNGSGVEFLVKL
jgi:hypothetical protein